MKKNLVPLIVLAVLAFFPLAVKDNYYMPLMILFLMWVVIGSAWNLIAGYTGQVSFGDAAFFGSGAYAAGLLSVHLHISAWRGPALGGFAAVAVGLPFGWICFRMRGAYFALATLALNEVMRHSAAIAAFWTGGAGLVHVARAATVPFRFKGARLDELPADRVISHGVVHVPEARRLFREMTVEENLVMGSLAPQAKKRRAETLAWVYEL